MTNCKYFDRANNTCSYQYLDGSSKLFNCTHFKGNEKEIRTEDFSSDVYFVPWIGQNYEKGLFRNKRTLILGNSFYCSFSSLNGPYEECKTNNRCMKQKYPACCFYGIDCLSLDYKGMTNTLKHLMGILAGMDYSDPALPTETESIKQSICFYNFVQEALDTGSSKPTRNQCISSDSAFFEVLEKLKPELIIALGTSHMWTDLPGDEGRYQERWEWKKPFEFENTSINQGAYSLECGKIIPILFIKHPSRNYNPKMWNRIINSWVASL